MRSASVATALALMLLSGTAVTQEMPFFAFDSLRGTLAREQGVRDD